MVTVTSIKSFSKKESLIFATSAILWNEKNPISKCCMRQASPRHPA